MPSSRRALSAWSCVVVVPVTVAVPVAVVVVVLRVLLPPLAHAPAEHADPDRDDQQRRDEVQPGIELIRDDELRKG